MTACGRFKASDAERAAIQARLDEADEQMREFERRDIKHREDRKHAKAKLKKAEDKLAKDSAALQACLDHQAIVLHCRNHEHCNGPVSVCLPAVNTGMNASISRPASREPEPTCSALSILPHPPVAVNGHRL